MQQPGSTIAANRFGLGARPGELAAIGGDGRDWLRAQLTQRPPPIGDAQLGSSAAVLGEALALQRQIQQARRSGNDAQQKLPQFLKPIYTAEATARHSQAEPSERAYRGRLAPCWPCRCAVSIDCCPVPHPAIRISPSRLFAPAKATRGNKFLT